MFRGAGWRSADRLAPAYDKVPFAHVPGSDGRVAMAVAGGYAIRAVTIAHLEQEVRSWPADPGRVRATLESLRDIVAAQTALPEAESLRPMIAASVERILAGRPIGDVFAG